jgi:hypothetical protein
MPRDDHATEELIERLYAAPFEPQLWQSWLEDLIEMLKSRTGQILLLDRASGAADWVAMQGHSAPSLAAYEQYFCEHDVVAQRALQTPGLRALTSQELVPDKEYLNSPIFNDFNKPYLDGAFRVIGSVFRWVRRR